MVKIEKLMLCGLTLAIMLMSEPSIAQQNHNISEQQASKFATEAYIYGYPLVTMNITRQVLTNTTSPQGNKAPMGQFANLKSFPDANFKDVTAPNADTLYSTAWLNLSQEPYILHVPDEQGRYYLMEMLDGWTNVFASPGTRTTGTKAQDFAIVGPNWQGTLPKGITEIKSPTNMVWILGRTYCNGTTMDFKAVHAIQNEYSLTPLSNYKKSYSPPTNNGVNPEVDMKTAPRVQVNQMNAETFFNNLAMLMKNNPPTAADKPMVMKLASLGIIPGQQFNINKLNPDVAKGVTEGAKAGLEQIENNIPKVGKKVNGWQVTIGTGKYSTNYLLRATVTYAGLGANLPEDAVYPMASVDGDGKPLNGQNNYVIHFAKGKLPPVRGFWSLTMYNDQFFFAANSLNRYNLNSRNKFTYNSDGSLDLYIQNKSPGQDKETNWLPAPSGNFNLMLRLYWPDKSILNGNWQPPIIKHVS